LTLDEAIQHSEEKAKELSSCACASEHLQLAQWLKELKELKENIMLINYTESIGSRKTEMVALYNRNVITQEEAVQAVKLAGIEQNRSIIFMTKEQYKNVFLL
jgi:hypothetical protein